jgi:hypothetical protein
MEKHVEEDCSSDWNKELRNHLGGCSSRLKVKLLGGQHRIYREQKLSSHTFSLQPHMAKRLAAGDEGKDSIKSTSSPMDAENITNRKFSIGLWSENGIGYQPLTLVN